MSVKSDWLCSPGRRCCGKDASFGGPPAPEASLQRPQLTRAELPRVPTLQLFEHDLRLKTGVDGQPVLDLVPHRRERILARARKFQLSPTSYCSPATGRISSKARIQWFPRRSGRIEDPAGGRAPMFATVRVV